MLLFSKNKAILTCENLDIFTVVFAYEGLGHFYLFKISVVFTSEDLGYLFREYIRRSVCYIRGLDVTNACKNLEHFHVYQLVFYGVLQFFTEYKYRRPAYYF